MLCNTTDLFVHSTQLDSAEHHCSYGLTSTIWSNFPTSIFSRARLKCQITTKQLESCTSDDLIVSYIIEASRRTLMLKKPCCVTSMDSNAEHQASCKSKRSLSATMEQLFNTTRPTRYGQGFLRFRDCTSYRIN